MNRRTNLAVLLLLAATALPGCAVSLFSEATRNPETEAKIKHMEQRMDAVDAKLEEQSAQ